MDIEVKTWLYDILSAISEIDSFFSDRPKEFSSYKNDLRTRRAVERNLEIIGEAMSRVLAKDEQSNFLIPEKLYIQETGSYMDMTTSQMK